MTLTLSSFIDTDAVNSSNFLRITHAVVACE